MVNYPFPDKEEFRVYYVYKAGLVILTRVRKEELDQFASTVIEDEIDSKCVILMLRKRGYLIEEIFEEEKFEQMKLDRLNRIEKFKEEFKEELFLLNSVSGPKAELLYQICQKVTHNMEYLEEYFTEFSVLIKLS
jgi:hypothetical protein